MKLIFATHNRHKLDEVAAMLRHAVDIVGLTDLGFHSEIPETGDTLEANALQKALFVWNNTGLACFADDTGLEVDALDGAPGVYSARYSGEPVNSERNIDKLLDALKGIENREAQFRTVIALKEGAEEHFFEGVVRGTIAYERSGQGGFGYDAVFVPQGYDKSFAELSPEEKNTISHRGRAIAALMAYLEQK